VSNGEQSRCWDVKALSVHSTNKLQEFILSWLEKIGVMSSLLMDESS